VVIAEGETRCANRLIAYVVPHEWAAPASLAKELSTFLGGDLPAYMVPARVELLAAFPLNANGKVDLSALCSMSVPMNEFLDPSDEPKTQTQRQIAKLWRRLLGLSRVGVHESFFEIGGDSLRSVEMISAAAAIGFQWRMKDLYERPTIAALCQLPSTPNRRKNHAERDGLIPLTPTQHWFFERGLRFPGRYNSVLAFDVVGSLDADRLTLAMHHLQAQHDALRLRFTSENGAWTQRIASCDVEPSVATWDLASCPEPAQSAEMQRRVAEMRCALDLASGPLAMAVLIDRGPSPF
jgi:aryl carrier-like protein